MRANSAEFNRNLNVGKAGEEVVIKHLESMGWIVYRPVTEGAHLCDCFATYGKDLVIALDVKTKPKMKWPNATGINAKHLSQYKDYSETHRKPFLIIFVDIESKTIYGNDIAVLEQRYVDKKGVVYPYTFQSSNGGKIRLWSCEVMEDFGDISDEDIVKIKNSLKSKKGV